METNATYTVPPEEVTTKKLLMIQMANSNISVPEETSTDRNLDLIRRKMMLMQIDMKRRGPDGMRHGGFGSGSLPLMPGKSPRPNVFETREERRRRLLDEERCLIPFLSIKIKL